MKVCAGDALADQVDVLWVASTGETLSALHSAALLSDSYEYPPPSVAVYTPLQKGGLNPSYSYPNCVGWVFCGPTHSKQSPDHPVL